MIYRPIKDGDFERILPLIESFCYETNADEAARRVIVERVSNGTDAVFIAQNGMIRGIIGGYMQGNVAIADFLYVLPVYRGRMIAGKLHRLIVDWAISQGAKKIAIFVDDTREPMYLKLGYKHKLNVLEMEV